MIRVCSLVFRAEHEDDPDPGQHLGAEEPERQARERAGEAACGVQQGMGIHIQVINQLQIFNLSFSPVHTFHVTQSLL